MKAIWNGDEKILPTGVEVTILATDPAGGLSLASSGPPVVVKHSNPRPMSPEGLGPDDLVNPAPRWAKSIV